MTKGLRIIWEKVNRILTFVNVLLFGLLTFTVTTEDLKKAQKTKVPLFANILLLVFFSLALVATLLK